MFWLAALMSLSIIGTIALGVFLELTPRPALQQARERLRCVFGANILSFIVAELGLVFVAAQNAMAESAVAAPHEVSIGMGLALIGAGIPTAVATLGAGIAIGPVGAAALAVISDKPEAFGRSLIFLGLAEGVAIYGLVVTILMLGKLG